jgi:hypothetical protein
MKKLLKIFLWILLFPFMLTYWGWKTKKKPVMVIGAVLSLIVVVGSFSGQESIDSASATESDPPIESVATHEDEAAHEDDANHESDAANESDAESTEIASEDPEADVAEAQTTPEDSPENGSEGTPGSISENTSESVEENPSEDSNPDATIPESQQASIFEGYRLIEVDGGDLSGYREANVVVNIGFGDREYWAFTNEHGQLIKVIADVIIPQDESREPVTSQGRYYPDEAKVPGAEASDLDEGHVIM